MVAYKVVDVTIGDVTVKAPLTVVESEDCLQVDPGVRF